MLAVDAMPMLMVLTLHQSEKTLLSLREIIKDEDGHTCVTSLEYLKQLHPVEWDNLIKDTKILAEGLNLFNGENFRGTDEEGGNGKTTDDLPFYCIGFKGSAPELTLRTRIWLVCALRRCTARFLV